MPELVCIVCPNGCRMTAERKSGVVTVLGNECPRGRAFAEAELTAPMRSVTGVVATAFEDFPFLPVKTEGEIPKSYLRSAGRRMSEIKLFKRLAVGDTVAEDFFGTRLIACSDMAAQISHKKIAEVHQSE